MAKSKDKLIIKTDYDIPRFSIKSAAFILFVGVITTLIVPYIFSLIGIDKKIIALIGNTFILSFALAYSRYFIETTKGFCKKFWYTYTIFGFMFFVITYFWMYLQIHI